MPVCRVPQGVIISRIAFHFLLSRNLFRSGEEDGDPGLVLGVDHGVVAHGKAGDVGDLVPGAGRELAHGEIVVTGAELEHRDPSFPGGGIVRCLVLFYLAVGRSSRVAEIAKPKGIWYTFSRK